LFYASGPTINCAVKRLQNQIDLASTWFKNWKVINPTKTTAVVYANKITFHTKNLQMEGNTIKWSTKTKYLGVTIDFKLHFTSHVTNAINKTKATKHCLFLKQSDSSQNEIACVQNIPKTNAYIRRTSMGLQHIPKFLEKTGEYSIKHTKNHHG